MTGSAEEFDHGLAAARAALGRGDRAEAEVQLRQAIGVAEHTAVDECELAAALNELATLRRDMDEPAEAEALFQRALTVLDGLPQPNEWLLLTTLTGLGGVLAARGESSQAEALLSRALAIGERRLGSDHQDLGGLLNDLSRLFLRSAAFAAAEPLLLRLYEIKRRSKGEDHPEAATVLASLALVRQSLGRHDEAETMWRRVLAVRERTLAPNHFATATALEHLAESCAARGKLAEALQLLRRATTMRELTLGPSHPSLRTARDRIADLQLQASDDAMDGFGPPPTLESFTPFPARPAETSARLADASPKPVDVSPRPADAAPRRVDAPHAPYSAPRSEANLFVSASRVDSTEGQSRPQQAFVFPGTSGALALQEPVVSRATQAVAAPTQQALMSLRAELEAAGDHDVELEDDEESTPRRGRVKELGAAAASLLEGRRMPVIVTGVIAAVLLLGAVATRSRASSDVGKPGDVASASSTEAVPVASIARPTDSTAATVPATASGSTAAVSHGTTVPALNEAQVPTAKQQTLNGDVAPTRSQTTAIAAPTARRLNLDSFADVVKAPRVLVDETYRVKLGADTPRQKLETSGVGDVSGELVRATLIGEPPQPKFPETLRDRRIEGEVVIRFTVDAQGRPDLSTFSVLRTPNALLTEAVRRVVPSMRFQPARRSTIGAPTEPDQVQMTFQFSNGAK